MACLPRVRTVVVVRIKVVVVVVVVVYDGEVAQHATLSPRAGATWYTSWYTSSSSPLLFMFIHREQSAPRILVSYGPDFHFPHSDESRQVIIPNFYNGLVVPSAAPSYLRRYCSSTLKEKHRRESMRLTHHHLSTVRPPFRL